MSAHRGILVVGIAVSVAFALVGCSGSTPAAHLTAHTPVAPSATPTPVPTFDPNGTASENLAYFDLVGHGLLDQHPSSPGKTIVDWFVAHGFDKAAMQVTPDKTSIGLQAWNIEFSVDINKTCLIGEAGNVGFQSYAGPLLATGKCLIGTTRTINW